MLDPVQVLAVLTAKPGHETALATLLQGLVAPTRAEQGVLFYDLHQDREDPARFVFFEGWASQAALDAHNASPHLVALQKQLPDLLVDGEVRRLKKIA
jgi:quinol monooxygenase YgiN